MPEAPVRASDVPLETDPQIISGVVSGEEPALTEEEGYGQHFTYQTPAVSSPHAPSAPSEPLPKYER